MRKAKNEKFLYFEMLSYLCFNALVLKEVAKELN
jgi:hypothetical protein